MQLIVKVRPLYNKNKRLFVIRAETILTLIYKQYLINWEKKKDVFPQSTDREQITFPLLHFQMKPNILIYNKTDHNAIQSNISHVIF